MTKKNKIIVSITGITLVLLILVGLTYAYFLTRIQGNTNTKSISVTTADLALTYGDGDGNIVTKTSLRPGEVVGTKTFTVTNTGDSETDYVVVLDEVNIKQNNTNTTFESNDFVYTLLCSVITGTGTCDSITDETTLPIQSNNTVIQNGMLIGNKIASGAVHTYTLTVTYKETGIDQSNDMNKTFDARVNIKDIKTINPYSSNTSSLAYNIINNAMTVKNGTELRATPLTKPADSISSFIYLKGDDPTTFTSSRSNATNYYISYADDYTVDEATGKFTLVNPVVATSKYTTSNASSLVGKYAVWQTSVPTISNTQNQSSIYKISTNVSDITSTIKYATINSSSLIQSPTEKELSVTSDDYGTSYYYRGGVEDNYVNFAGMCWRIVRIEGDGSIKIILEDSTYECDNASFNGNWSIGNTIAFGYDSNNKADFLGYTGGLADALKAYQTTLNTKIGTKYSGKTLSDYLKIDEWCYDHNVTEYKYWDSEFNELPNSTGAEYIDEYYGAYTRLETNKQPSLNCTGTKINKFRDNTDMYVGTLTADEIALAGAKDGASNYTYYLLNSYARTNGLYWWGLSPVYWVGENGSDGAFRVDSIGYLSYDYVYVGNGSVARSAVSLKSSTEILSGEGTKANPYTIS